MNSTKIIIISSIILLIIIIIAIYNKLKVYCNKVEESLSGIDIALSKRYNTITQLVEVVKGYAKYEHDLLVDVIALRSNKMTIEELNEVSKVLDDNYEKITALAEAYPNIKANENFMHLQTTIVDIEEHLQAARRLYNSNVSYYNQLIEMFPTNIMAKLTGMKKKDFFKIDKKEKNLDKINV